MRKFSLILLFLAAGLGLGISAPRIADAWNRLAAPRGRTASPIEGISLTDIDPTQTRLVIDKGDYELILYEGDRRIRTYPAVLGPNPVDDKMQEGDGCTPEGAFTIQSKYPHAKWSHFLWIDYPNAASRAKFAERKRKGIIPEDARIGGEIGIHGVPAGYDSMIDRGVNWTLGCISVSNAHIQEIYPLVQTGTEVLIRK